MTPFSRRRALLGLTASALGIGAPTLGRPSLAHASLSVALTLPELTQGSARIVRGLAQEHYSQWESANGRKRIVTYTRVVVTEDLSEGAGDSEVMVMTWGGRVGEVAQLIHGEAALPPNQESVIFLSGERNGARRVTAMAQGHYPMEAFQGRSRLLRSKQLDALVPKAGAAVDTLHQRSYEDAKRLIQGARK
jgi:hypothetical protein